MFQRIRNNMMCRFISFLCMTFLSLQADVLLALADDNAAAATTRFTHAPYSYAVPGNRITITGTINDPAGIKIARCYFKASGEADYVFVPMQKQEGTLTIYSATMPALSNNTKSIQYLLLAVNNSGQVAKTAEFVIPVTESLVVPGWQSSAIGRAAIRVSTELAKAPETVSGFTDDVTVDAVESTARFMVASEVGVASGLAVSAGSAAASAGTAGTAVSAAAVGTAVVAGSVATGTIMGLSATAFWLVAAGVAAVAVGGAAAAASGGGGGGSKGGGGSTGTGSAIARW